MPLLEYFLLRLLLWVGLPTALVVLAIGPRRVGKFIGRGWRWLWRRRADPEELLTQVVRQHQELVAAVKKALAQGEKTESQIQAQIAQSETNIATLENNARRLTEGGDELGARGEHYKIQLERMAVQGFQEQLGRARGLIADSRRRLYSLELQLRQYEVGRNLLLSQLAEAEGVEQQYAIVAKFDPYNAVADWQKAEGIVQDKALEARAIERVYRDLSELGAKSLPTRQLPPPIPNLEEPPFRRQEEQTT